MKLLYITNGITGAGGLERVLSIKASYLAEKFGYEVHIAVLNHKPEAVFYDFSPRITLHNVVASGNPLRYITQYKSGLKALVSKIAPDVISVCDDGLKAFFLPFILGKPCPMVYERHVSKIIAIGPNPTPVKRWLSNVQFRLMNALGKRYDRFVVLTRDNVAEWDLSNILVIPNPLSFYPKSVSSLKNKRVIAVGKQGFQKGYDRLLQSWSLLHKDFPDWELEIYGKHDPSERLAEQAETLGISGSIHFYAAVRDIAQKYLESSVYVMSSRFEGFGMVLIEAMACGVPCVSFDCPCGPSEIIADGEDGFLAPNNDTEALARGLRKLMEDDALRYQMGAKARDNVRRFMPEIVLKQWDDLFKTLVK